MVKNQRFFVRRRAQLNFGRLRVANGVVQRFLDGEK